MINCYFNPERICGMEVFENRRLRKIFGSKIEEVSGG
jgi:hypothetical protein